MSPSIQPHLPLAVPLADMAALAAFVSASSPASRLRPFFAGGSLPPSRCHCRMAAANTVLPAAKSANPPSSRRPTT